MSIDPLSSQYPHNSTYAFSENRVIDAWELEGLEAKVIVESGNKLKANFGHTMVAVGTGNKTTVYTYGRYGDLGKDKGSLNGTNLTGQGVLVKLQGNDALNEIKNYVNKNEAKVFEIGDADEGKVSQFFEDKFNSSDEKPGSGKYKDKDNARVIDNYDLLDNNCTTISIDGIEAGLEDGILDFEQQTMYGNKFNYKINTVDPATLKSELNTASSKKNSNITDVTKNYKNEKNEKK